MRRTRMEMMASHEGINEKDEDGNDGKSRGN